MHLGERCCSDGIFIKLLEDFLEFILKVGFNHDLDLGERERRPTVLGDIKSLFLESPT